MSTDPRSTKQPVRPAYPQRTRAEKAATAFVAVLVSSALLGGVLTLFEKRAEETAMAAASVWTHPATVGVAAARKIDPLPLS